MGVLAALLRPRQCWSHRVAPTHTANMARQLPTQDGEAGARTAGAAGPDVDLEDHKLCGTEAFNSGWSRTCVALRSLAAQRRPIVCSYAELGQARV